MDLQTIFHGDLCILFIFFDHKVEKKAPILNKNGNWSFVIHIVILIDQYACIQTLMHPKLIFTSFTYFQKM
ncbi:hypothetical protein Lalb_Chr08g0235401 [Lupinus albus]|uniref:Uncharacterized protein n=1 Tax=Lupinus albus TaxID=3870 RepID=A0A6A4Q4Q3_LUPAL|nr:hypothetical protein Lalb_Chr08g0235401 [Lupinus albus]